MFCCGCGCCCCCCYCFMHSAPENCTGTHVCKKIGSAWLLDKAGGTSPLLLNENITIIACQGWQNLSGHKTHFFKSKFSHGQDTREGYASMSLFYVAIIVLSLLEQVAASYYNKNELTIKHTVPELHLVLQHLDKLRNKIIIITKFCYMLQLYLGHLGLNLLKFK